MECNHLGLNKEVAVTTKAAAQMNLPGVMLKIKSPDFCILLHQPKNLLTSGVSLAVYAV
jgi:hypothetical protein